MKKDNKKCSGAKDARGGHVFLVLHSNVLVPGQTVQGTVSVDVPHNSQQKYLAVTVEVTGVAHVSVGSGEHRKTCTTDAFRKLVVLDENAGSLPGKRTLPFQVTIPSSAPPSFAVEHKADHRAWVIWRVTACMHKPGLTRKLQHQLPLHILEHPSKALPPPTQRSTDMTDLIGGCCCSGGSTAATSTLTYPSNWALGETSALSVTVATSYRNKLQVVFHMVRTVDVYRSHGSAKLTLAARVWQTVADLQRENASAQDSRVRQDDLGGNRIAPFVHKCSVNVTLPLCGASDREDSPVVAVKHELRATVRRKHGICGHKVTNKADVEVRRWRSSDGGSTRHGYASRGTVARNSRLVTTPLSFELDEGTEAGNSPLGSQGDPKDSKAAEELSPYEQMVAAMNR